MICLLFITLPSFATAQTQVCGLNYGQDETWINQTFDQNSLLTYTTLDIEVAGTIRVIDGATLSITTCTLHIADDARIIVEEGATLILEGCTLLSCNNAMWDGIYIESNSRSTICG